MMSPFAQALFNTGLSNAAVASLLAVVVAAATKAVRRPALVYGLWLLVLLKFISPALIDVAVEGFDKDSLAPAALPAVFATDPLASREPLAADDSPTVAAAQVERGQTPDVARHERIRGTHRIPEVAVDTEGSHGTTTAIGLALARTTPYLLAAWLSGGVLYFFVAARRLSSFRRVLRHAPAASPAMRSEVERLATILQLRQPPDLRIVEADIPPSLCPMGRRCAIVLPRRLVDRLDRGELRMVLAHELIHLRRKDHYLFWLELLVVGLYWWQPIAWLARRRLQQAAEQCCDAEVIRTFPRQVRDYAEALLKTVDFLGSAASLRPGIGLAFARPGLLQRRFEMILRPNAVDRLPRAVTLAVLLVGLAVLPISIHTLWAGGSRADDQPQKQVTEQLESETKAAAEAPNDIDSRLARLEKLVESLTDELKSHRVKTTNDAEPSPSPDLVKARENAIEMDQSLDTMKRFYAAFRSAQARVALFETGGNRRDAADKNLKTVNRAYLDGKATLDLLLDGQRRAIDAETSWARLAVDLSDLEREDREKLYSEFYLNTLTSGRDAALATYRHVQDLHKRGAAGGEAEKVAQASEQYSLFRGQVETALRYHLRLQGTGKQDSTPK